MTLFDPPTPTLDNLFQNTLPDTICCAGNHAIARRAPRVILRASWRDTNESICSDCWTMVCEWAVRFSLRQDRLPGV
jgi:hypothetical protein